MALIDQKQNYHADFGDVLRSSAIFYVLNNDQVTTVISFANYWFFKNKLEVAVIANWRFMDGHLHSRQRVDFQIGQVANLSPPQNFEGSVEIEVFGLQNLRIPYAAIMALYETASAVAMVHSYARAYSLHEVEEGRTLCEGNESCWTISERKELTSFAVAHNGAWAVAPQECRLRVRRSDGDELEKTFLLSALAPYETVVFTPLEHFPQLKGWLNGLPGNARVSFQLGNGFTRLLCGWHNADFSQLQVTHSNFDYSTHQTDLLSESESVAYMQIPDQIDDRRCEVVVYPDRQPGEYLLAANHATQQLSTSAIETLNVNGCELLKFERHDGALPSRIVTGLRFYHNECEHVIPAECSLGVLHDRRPGKSFHWMLVSGSHSTHIYVTSYMSVYGEVKDSDSFTFSLWSAIHDKPLTKTFEKHFWTEHQHKLRLTDIFPNAHEFLGQQLGYLTLWSSYRGLLVYTSLTKGESLCIEHSF